MNTKLQKSITLILLGFLMMMFGNPEVTTGFEMVHLFIRKIFFSGATVNLDSPMYYFIYSMGIINNIVSILGLLLFSYAAIVTIILCFRKDKI